MGIQRKPQIYVQLSTNIWIWRCCGATTWVGETRFHSSIWSRIHPVHFLPLLWRAHGMLPCHTQLSPQRKLTHVFPLSASQCCSPSSSGVTELEMTVPDTITEWKAGALCLSNDTGLGLSSVATLQAFQPFFVELTMPYSVIRGEAFTLKATVMNYLPTSLPVNTFLN